MNVQIEPSWKEAIGAEFEKTYFKQLVTFIRDEYSNHIVYPPGKMLFNAFNYCPFNEVKVVIIGQDPYHGQGQAHGLSFSVQDGVPIPPSLENIYKELVSDIGVPYPESGNLTHWAKQGVLLLNTVLSVREKEPQSHQNKGWEFFTDAVIRAISERKDPVVFILWGSPAQKKEAIIDSGKHLILKAVHPSPLSAYRGFFGSKPFSQTNAFLEKQGKTPIAW
ncbi:MAG: uracil-DNA glycosylase [Flexibacteraceae bacterium]